MNERLKLGAIHLVGMDRIKTLLIWSVGLLLFGAAAGTMVYAQESPARKPLPAVSAGNAQTSSAQKSPPALLYFLFNL